VRDNDIVAGVVDYYESKLAAFGATPQGVDWKDDRSQRERFVQLVRALGLETFADRFTILDFGCGYGALLPFLREQGFAFSYTGYDRSPQMIDAARRAHAGIAEAQFTSEWASIDAVDFVVGSGVFNVRMSTPLGEWQEYVMRMLAMIDAKAKRCWAANFLTSYSDEHRKRADLFYADPAILFGWCQRSASRWVSLLHDYDLYEFTIGVHRRPR